MFISMIDTHKSNDLSSICYAVLEELVKTTESDILFEPEIQESHILYKFKKEKAF